MGKSGPALLGLFALVLPASCPAAKPVTLKPTSKWLVNWGDDSCTLGRAFGSPEKPEILSMQTFAPGYHFKVTVTGKLAGQLNNAPRLFAYFGNGERIAIEQFQAGRSDRGDPAVVLSVTFSARAPKQDEDDEADMPVYPDAAFEAGLDRIVIGGGARQLVYETGPLAKAMDALRTCTDDLVKQWGLDPQQQRQLTRRLTMADKSWMRDIRSFFPAELAIARAGARLDVQVVVDAQGVPTQCHFTQAFNNTDFKVRACDVILKKARFQPALGADGAPVASFYTTAIIYRIY